LGQNLSDIDGAQQNQPYVGLFGGVIGELTLLLSALKSLSQEDGHDALKKFFSNKENIKKLVQETLRVISEAGGSVEIGISAQGERQITERNAEINLTNVQQAPANLKEEIVAILKANLGSLILRSMQSNPESARIDPEHLDAIVNSVFESLFGEDEVKNKIKLVKTGP